MLSTCPECASQSSPASPGSPNETSFIVVRSDLPRGPQGAHIAHAAQEAAGYRPTVMVVLQVPNEQALRDIAEALGKNSLTYKLIEEDAGPYAGQAMAIGIQPTEDRKAVGKVTSSLPTLK